MNEKPLNPIVQIDDLQVCKTNTCICQVAKLSVDQGERIAIIGPNGCGKSTLLRVLGGLEREFVGKCEVRVALRQRVVVHQTPYLFRGTVLANTAYGLAARGMPGRQQPEIANHWLDVLGVQSLANRLCENLSGGERRRVALARALAVEPDLLLLDEPLAELDPAGIELVIQALAELPATVLIASPGPVPSDLATREVLLRSPQENRFQ